MDHRSPSFEASLLFKTASLPSLADIIEDLTAVIEINGESLEQVDRVDSMFTILTCGRVQVLLAFSPDALPVAHFLNANRPGAASLSEVEILSRMTEMRAMATVLVIDRDLGKGLTLNGPAKRDICWDIADCLFQNSDADLVYWSESDMLYAGEEFERACTYFALTAEDGMLADPVQSRLQLTGAIPLQIDKAPTVDLLALTRSDALGRNPPLPGDTDRRTRQAPRRGAGLTNTMFGGLAQAVHRIRHGIVSRRMVNGSALACTSATVSMTSLPNLTQLLS